MSQLKCGCGRGYASSFDNQCRFCREIGVRRAVAKKVGVRHRGDGMTVEQYKKVTYTNEEFNLERDFGGL